MDARTMEPRKPEIGNSALYSDVIAGMSRSPKGLSPKWFYDDRGSAIFEEITQLSEYYPSRTERAILETGLARIEAHVPAGAALVELGSGASVRAAAHGATFEHPARAPPLRRRRRPQQRFMPTASAPSTAGNAQHAGRLGLARRLD